MSSNFADRLKEIRAEKSMTQVQLAEAINVSHGTVAMWETGKREPNFETLNKLSKLFDKRIDYILGYSDESPSAKQLEEDPASVDDLVQYAMTFGDKVKNRRLKLGLTLEAVAQAVGVSAPTIQRYESGEINTTRTDKLNALAQVLHVTPSYLIGSEDQPQSHEETTASIEDLMKYAELLQLELRKDVWASDARLCLIRRRLTAIYCILDERLGVQV